MSSATNSVWQNLLGHILHDPQYVPSARGMEAREVLAGQYRVPMPAFLSLADRKINAAFMFAEAEWILSGSNRLEDLTPYMKVYEKFSDDGVFLQGAYGPKVTDQLPYVVGALLKDPDSRQAYLNIWRERPIPAKDIACTTGMQFIRRAGELHAVVTMRSQDAIKGFTFDVFTFSMVANAVRLLVNEQGDEDVRLGDLTVTAGSLHIYRDDFDGSSMYEKAERWAAAAPTRETGLEHTVDAVMTAATYPQLREYLHEAAEEYRHL